MTPLQLAYFAGLPISVAIVGFATGEIFRWRAMKEPRRAGEDISRGWVYSPPWPQEKDLSALLSSKNQAAEAWNQAKRDVENLAEEDKGAEKAASFRKLSLEIIRSRIKIDELISTYREIYGANFGLGLSDNEKLSEVLDKLDAESVAQLLRSVFSAEQARRPWNARRSRETT